jgi:FMN phosphatase YigB (HAD superfamily)
MIGDNYFNDCAGAKDAGMKTILLNAQKIKGRFPKADKVILSMEELPDAIENL